MDEYGGINHKWGWTARYVRQQWNNNFIIIKRF